MMCILPNCKLVSEMVTTIFFPIIIEHHYMSIRWNDLGLNVLLIIRKK